MADIKIVALGGLDERGKNLYVIEINNDIFIFDIGLKLPLREMLGIDVIIPKFDYLLENKNRIKAIFISKPSDDNFGALPYLLKNLNHAKDIKRGENNKLLITIYGSALTRFMLDQKLKRFRLNNWEKIITFKEVDYQDTIYIANTNVIVEPFRTTTSLPGSLGYAIHSSNRPIIDVETHKFDDTIVYTGDYIFDGHETDDFNMSISKIANIRLRNRNEQVLLLISESGYAMRRDYTAPNHKIQNLIETKLEAAPGRIIFACYEQDLFRINEILQAIHETYCNRAIAVHGQTLSEILKVISNDDNNSNNVNIKGFNVTFDNKNTHKIKIISLQQAAKSKNAVIIVTGSGERLFTKMSKITTGNDELLSLKPDDTVILATPPIPGNELAQAAVLDDLARTDANVTSISDKQTWNVNASYEDIKLLTNMMRPKYFLPVKGLYKDLAAARNAAIEAGVLHNNALIHDNGEVIVFKDGILTEYAPKNTPVSANNNNKLHQKVNVIETDDVYVDGIGVGDIGALVLDERKKLMTDGVVIVGLTIDKKTKEVISLIDAQMRGVVFLTNPEEMLKDIQATIIKVIEKYQQQAFLTNDIKNKIKYDLQTYLEKQTGKRPMILPVINEI